MNPPHITSYSAQYPQYSQPQGQSQAGAANPSFYYGNYQHPQQQYYYNGTPSAPATGSNSASGSVTGSPATNSTAVTAGGDATANSADIAASYQQQGYYGTPLYQQTAGTPNGQSSAPSSNQPHHQHLHHHIQQQQQQSQQIQAQTPYYNQYPPYMQTHQGGAATAAQYGTHSLQAQHSLVAQQHPQHQQQHTSQQVAQTHQQPAVVTDPTGQIAPPGSKPKVTTTLWEDEGTLCFQVEAKGICVARREDNDMINGTKLLNVAGMTRGRRDGILKGEKNRHVVKAGAMHLKGVWIPYDRALDFANKEKIIDLLYPLFVTDIKAVLYHPANYARTAQVISAAAERRKDLAAAANSASGSPTSSSAPGVNTNANAGNVQSSQSYYYHDGRKEAGSSGDSPTAGNRKLPQLPNPPSSASPSVIQGVQGAQSTTGSGNTNGNTSDGYSGTPNSRVPTPNSNAFANSNGQTQSNGGQQTTGNEYPGSTTPLTDSVPHTPSSSNLLHKTNGNTNGQTSSSDDHKLGGDANPVTVVSNSGNNSSNTSPKIYEESNQQE